MKQDVAIRLHYSFLKVMTGYDLSTRRIPVMEIKSREPYPVIVLTACMHGDEIGGTVVVHELFKKLKKQLLCGKIVAFPLLNPFGFETSSRRISLSNEDLNRSFPGNNKGTLAQRIAYRVVERIKELNPALVLDLHNDWNKSIPYVLIDQMEASSLLNKLYHYALLTRLPAIKETEIIPNSFSHSLNSINIPSLTLELGESLTINEKNVTHGISAIEKILIDFNMLHPNGDFVNADYTNTSKNKIFIYSHEPLCSTSGIIRFTKKPGDLVTEGEKIAKVYNAFGKLRETITAGHSGIILGQNDYAVAYPGSPVMSFGVYEAD